MEVELYDGTILEFPDDTDPAVVQRVVKAQTASKQGLTPEALAEKQPGRITGPLVNELKAIPATLGFDVEPTGPTLASKALDAANTAARYSPFAFGGVMNPRFQRWAEEKALGYPVTPSPDEADEPLNAGPLQRGAHQLSNFRSRLTEGAARGFTGGVVQPQQTQPYAPGSGEVPAGVPLIGGQDIERGAVQELPMIVPSLMAGPHMERALGPIARRFGPRLGPLIANALGEGIEGGIESFPHLQGNTAGQRFGELGTSMAAEAVLGGAIEGVGKHAPDLFNTTPAKVSPMNLDQARGGGPGVFKQAGKPLPPNDAPGVPVGEFRAPSPRQIKGQSGYLEWKNGQRGLRKMGVPREQRMTGGVDEVNNMYRRNNAAIRATDQANVREANTTHDVRYDDFARTLSDEDLLRSLHPDQFGRVPPRQYAAMEREYDRRNPNFRAPADSANLVPDVVDMGLDDFDPFPELQQGGPNQGAAYATPHTLEETNLAAENGWHGEDAADFVAALRMFRDGLAVGDMAHLPADIVQSAGNAHASSGGAFTPDQPPPPPGGAAEYGAEGVVGGPLPDTNFDPDTGTNQYRPRTMDRLHPQDPVGPRRAQPGKALSRDPEAVIPDRTRAMFPEDDYLAERTNAEGKRVRERAGIRPEELDAGINPDENAGPALTREEIEAEIRSLGEGERSPNPANVRQGRKDRGEAVSDDEFFKKVTGEYGAFPGAQGAKDLLNKGVEGAKKVGGRIRDRLLRETDKDFRPHTAGFNPRGDNAPPKRVGFPGRGLGAPSFANPQHLGPVGPNGPRLPQTIRHGSTKSLGGGLRAHDPKQATSVIGRAGELITTDAKRTAQRWEMASRKAIPTIRGLFNRPRDWKTPGRVIKWMGRHSGALAKAKRLLRRGRHQIRKMKLDRAVQREWVERREAGHINPEENMPASVQPYFKELRRQIDEASAGYRQELLNAARIAAARGDVQGRKYYRGLATAVKKQMGTYLHRSYSQKPASTPLKAEVRGMLEQRWVVGQNGVVQMIDHDTALPMQGATPITMAQMSPAQRERANTVMDKWMTDTVARKEALEAPTAGSTGIQGATKVTRHRQLHDPAMRLLRGADKSAYVGENTLALIRAQTAQITTFNRIADALPALTRLSPDKPGKMPQGAWLGGLSGQEAPKWLADLITDNFSHDMMGPEALKSFASAMKWWKGKQTIGNLASHGNQFKQNFVNGWIGGMNPADPRTFNAMRMAHKEMGGGLGGYTGSGTRGSIAEILEADGVLESFTESEFQTGIRKDLDRAFADTNQERAKELFDTAMEQIHIRGSDAYSYPDRLSKIAFYIRATGLDGGEGLRPNDWSPPHKHSREEAIELLNDTYVNFSQPSRATTIMRNSGLGQMFLTPFYAAKAGSIPIWSRMIARRPLTVLSFLTVASQMGTFAWDMMGVDQDEQDFDLAMQPSADKKKLRMATPPIMGNELEALDFSSGTPGFELMQAFKMDPDESSTGNFMEVMTNLLSESFLSGPFTSAVHGKYATKFQPEREFEDQLGIALMDHLLVPGGTAQRKRAAEVYRALQNANKPGSKPEAIGSSDQPDERLIRRTMALGGMAPQPLDGRTKLRAVWEQKATQAALKKRYPAILGEYIEGRIDTDEAIARVQRLMEKEVSSMKSLVPPPSTPKRKYPWQKPTQPDVSKTHTKASIE